MRKPNTFTIEEVKAHWNKVAHIVDETNHTKLNPHFWRYIEGIKYVEPSDSDLKVLNILSGTGDALSFIRGKLPNAVIYNLDYSIELNKIAEQKHPSETFTETDLANLGIESDSIDYIICPETLEHTPDPQRLIREFYRVLKPTKGKLILSLPPRVADIHQWVWEHTVGGHGDGPRKGIPSWTVKEILKEEKFKLEKHKAILLIPIGPKWLIEFGNKILDFVPFLRELGIMQFYVCTK